MKSKTVGLLLAALVSSSAQAAGNSLNPILDDRWSFSLGATYLDADGTFSKTNEGEPTDNLTTDELDLNDSNFSPYFSARWRFTDRWRASFSYFGLDTDGHVRQDFNRLIFGTIDVSGFLEVKSELSTDFYIAQVGYSFLKNDRAELGLGGGLHVADFDASLKVSGGINNVSGSIQSDSSDLTVPMPNILGFGTYAFTPKLSLDGSVAWFGLNYDEYSGDMVALTANLEYRFTDKFGVGVGYNYIDMDLEIDKSSRTDKYNLDYKGPVLYVSAGF